jgi:TIR domain
VASSDFFLFVSHVAENRTPAMEIVDELERRGTRCWIAPRDIRPGMPFDDAIVEAIETSRAMLLIFSDLCNESEYIRREVTVAGESRKTIIPFRIEDAQPRKGLRVRLSDLHWIDAFVSRERALDELVKSFVPTANDPHRSDPAPSAMRDAGKQTTGTIQAEPKPADTTAQSPPIVTITAGAAAAAETATAAKLEPVAQRGEDEAGNQAHVDPAGLSGTSRQDAKNVSQPPGEIAVAARARRWPILIGAVAVGVLILVFMATNRQTPTTSPTTASRPTAPPVAASTPTAPPAVAAAPGANTGLTQAEIIMRKQMQDLHTMLLGIQPETGIQK